MGRSARASSAFAFSGRVWYWRGPSPYYFVRVPPEQSDDLAELTADVSYGWGMIPVEVTLDGHTWETSLWPKDGGYLVPIRARIRRSLGIDADDVVTLQLTVATRDAGLYRRTRRTSRSTGDCRECAYPGLPPEPRPQLRRA